MADSPVAIAPYSNTKLQIGQLGNGSGGKPESFDTYVMYRPKPSEVNNLPTVWVAIGKLHWEWAMWASRDTMTNQWQSIMPTPDQVPVAATSVSVPVPTAEMFPHWTDRTSAILNRVTDPPGPNSKGWVEY